MNKKDDNNKNCTPRENQNTIPPITSVPGIIDAPPKIVENEKLQELINSLNNVSITSSSSDKELFMDINSKLDKINSILNSTQTTTEELDITKELTELLAQVTTLNGLKNQLNELPFNTFEKIYVENCIAPLLTVFYQLSIAAASFKDTSQSLSLSTTTRRKTHKIKKYEKTSYDIMDQITCLYNLLEPRIYNFIEIICKCK